MRPRYVKVLVLRDDSQQRQFSLRTESLLGLGTSTTQIGGGRENTGMVIELPAYQNDVLNALTRTGGLPGLESTQEVIIQRGYWDGRSDPMAGEYGHPSQADLDERRCAAANYPHSRCVTRGGEPAIDPTRRCHPSQWRHCYSARGIRSSITLAACCPPTRCRCQTTMI